jgi:hypothetical protein
VFPHSSLILPFLAQFPQLAYVKMCIHKLYIFHACGHHFFSPVPVRRCAVASFPSLRRDSAVESSIPWPAYTQHPYQPDPDHPIPLSARRICTQGNPPTTTPYSTTCTPTTHPCQTRRLNNTLCYYCALDREQALQQSETQMREIRFAESKWRVAYSSPAATTRSRSNTLDKVKGAAVAAASAAGVRFGQSPTNGQPTRPHDARNSFDVAIRAARGSRTGYSGGNSPRSPEFVKGHPLAKKVRISPEANPGASRGTSQGKQFVFTNEKGRWPSRASKSVQIGMAGKKAEMENADALAALEGRGHKSMKSA